MNECCNEACINELGLDKCKYSNKIKCPNGCLHGSFRDVVTGTDEFSGKDIYEDIECGKCNGQGFIDGN